MRLVLQLGQEEHEQNDPSKRKAKKTKKTKIKNKVGTPAKIIILCKRYAGRSSIHNPLSRYINVTL